MDGDGGADPESNREDGIGYVRPQVCAGRVAAMAAAPTDGLRWADSTRQQLNVRWQCVVETGRNG